MVKTTTELLEKLKSKDVSITKIAKDTGIPRNRIYQWIAGRGTPGFEDAQILYKYFDKKGVSSTDSYTDKWGVVHDPARAYYRTSADFDLRQTVGIIQAVNNWTIEQVAQSIGYTRVGLGMAMDKDDQAIKGLLTDKFSHILKKVPQPSQPETPCGEIVQQMQSTIDAKEELIVELKAALRRLEKMIDLSLNSVEQRQLVLLAYQKAANYLQADLAAGPDKKKQKELRAYADKLLSESIRVAPEKGSQDRK